MSLLSGVQGAKHVKMYRGTTWCVFYVMCFDALKPLSVATQ